MSWQMGCDSFSKCIAYFEDGNTRTFYSLDWRYKQSKQRDRQLGLNRLRKLINSWGAKARLVILYDQASNQEIERYQYGIKQNETQFL